MAGSLSVRAGFQVLLLAGAMLGAGLAGGCGGSSSGSGSSWTVMGNMLTAPLRAQQAATRIMAVNNLKQIAIAFHIYHDVNNVFPTEDPGPGQPKMSWRVRILPFIEQDALYQQYRPGEPWDSPNNKKLLDKMPRLYLNPRFQKQEDRPSVTYYRGFVGTGGVLGVPGGASLTAITNANGSSNTFLVVEAGEPVPWTKPDELVHDPQKPLPPLGGPARGDFYAAFCDGHVQMIPRKKVDDNTIRCMINWMNTIPFPLP
jgi:hypothetical protein